MDFGFLFCNFKKVSFDHRMMDWQEWNQKIFSPICVCEETLYVWSLRYWVKKKNLDITKYKIYCLVYVQMIGTSIIYWGWNWKSTHLVMCSTRVLGILPLMIMCISLFDFLGVQDQNMIKIPCSMIYKIS